METLVAVMILAAVAAILLLAAGGPRKAAQSSVCLSQLRQITAGLRQYGVDNSQYLPDPAVTGVSWARSIQPYVSSSSTFACPADHEVFPLTGISYDWRDTGDPSTTMAGRTIDGAMRKSAVLSFESLPGWHAARKVNAGLLDGSTHAMDETDCFKDLITPLRPASASPP